MKCRMLRLLGISLLVSVLIVAPDQEVRAIAAPDWKPVTIIYRVEGLSLGHAGAPVTTVWRLTYQDVRHWRKELVAGGAPHEVGTVTAMAGTTYTRYSAVAKDTMTSEYPDVPMVPERWLIPDRERFLVWQGYTQTSDADGRHTRHSKTERYPCVTAPCAAMPDFQVTETIVYETVSGFPVALLTEVESIVTQRIVVTQLTSP